MVTAAIEHRLHRVTPAVGAVVEGVDLGTPLSVDTLDFIRRSLFEHGVLFFRDQQASVEQLWAFLKNFGTPQRDDSFGSDDDTPSDVIASNLLPTKGGTAVWHADSTFLGKPPKITLLRALSLPPIGGDTCWASMTAAYAALAEPLRDMLDQLTAVHSIDQAIGPLGDYGGSFATNFRAIHAPQQIHPVVQVHPETGRKALFVTESATSRIVEVTAAQSRHLLAMLYEHVKSPEFALRWHWSANDLALWDNRVVQHYAVPDYTSARVMQRIIVAGDRPVGP